ncbi:MAG TPA: cytochrome c oxidase assembly protein [Steroidobacteraceae bacterium]|nr:cytochrome c oxidase assembly protein [Steroidobacteraceae bacterium]
MIQPVPYCGLPPLPGDILTRFNLDPRLVLVLALCCAVHVLWLRHRAPELHVQGYKFAFWGWAVTALALLSPICALSVSLFAARVGQHMLLVLVAAPLIALGWPRSVPAKRSWPIWASSALFFLALWYWHMPVPYQSTFGSVFLYWTMHVTLFGSSIILWREFLAHSPSHTAQVLAAGSITFVQMGLLGAVLALASRPMFPWHFVTTQAWGLTPLQDQQLGGAVMWVPGILLFLWTAIRSMSRLWESVDRVRVA